MNKKVLIEEIKRVREVMGLPSKELPNNFGIILEQPNALVRLTQFLLKKGVVGKFIIRGGPLEQLFTKNEDFFWKMKNKYSDELEHVKDVDGLINHVVDNPNALPTQRIMRDMFMDNPETRALLAGAADNMVGGISKLDNMVDIEMFVKSMDDLGIPITVDDLAKVADDIFPVSMMGKVSNPIRVAIKNSGKIPKNLFGKRRKKGLFGTRTNTSIEKGNVVLDVMRDQGVKTSDDAQEFLLKIGMNEADAAKVKVAIEQGTTVSSSIGDDIFVKLGQSTDTNIQLSMVDMVSSNTYLKSKIQTGGASGGKMTKDEIVSFLGWSGKDIPDGLLLDISETIGTKKIRNPFRVENRKVLPMSLSNEGWYTFYLRRRIIATMSLGYKKVYGLLTLAYAMFWFYHIVPFGGIFGYAQEGDPKWIKWLFGTEGGGTFDCENNIECILKPTSENMAKVKRLEYVGMYLVNNNNVVDPLYKKAAEDIGKELGTYKDGKWFTEASLENFEPPYSVSETGILNILNERKSLFGILRIATDYYDITSRQLWDDCDLMKFSPGTYAEFLSKKWQKFDWIPWLPNVRDVGKEILKSLMSKPQRTIMDSDEVSYDKDPRDRYNELFKFPKTLFLTDNNDEVLERWKCCYKGPMPIEFVNFMTSAEQISTKQAFQNISPEDFNSLYKKYAAQKYQTRSNAYMRPTIEKDVDGVKEKVYSFKGTTECGTPQPLKGMTYDEMKSGLEEDVNDFLNLLKNGNNNNPPVKNGKPNQT